MNLSIGLKIAIGATALAVGALAFTTFERPPVVTSQVGYRGTGMELVYNPRTLARTAALHAVPEAPDPADTDGPKASELYENVKVLGELSAAQFGRIMQSMTEWIAPEQGCAYCHNPENLADDSVYTKVVARRMLQMTRTINAQWTAHVGQTGVTCYTCHRGHPVPTAVWATPANEWQAYVGTTPPVGAEQNRPNPQAGLSSLPRDPFTPYLLNDGQIRVANTSAFPPGPGLWIQDAEWTYSLMMHFSQALNVDCLYCHNSRAFANWEQSPPARTTSWHGIRMTRQLNTAYVQPLAPLWAANPAGPPAAQGTDAARIARLGPHGDPMKVNCTTCHNGAFKPLYGVPMLRDYPELNLVNATAQLSDATPR